MKKVLMVKNPGMNMIQTEMRFMENILMVLNTGMNMIQMEI